MGTDESMGLVPLSLDPLGPITSHPELIFRPESVPTPAHRLSAPVVPH